jgi:hypothetical protein
LPKRISRVGRGMGVGVGEKEGRTDTGEILGLGVADPPSPEGSGEASGVADGVAVGDGVALAAGVGEATSLVW